MLSGLKGSFFLLLIHGLIKCHGGDGGPFGLISKVQTDCETNTVTFGSKLVDSFSSYDEATEREYRNYHENLVESLGFSHWIQSGLSKHAGLTTNKHHASALQKVIFSHIYILFEVAVTKHMHAERGLEWAQEYVSVVLLGVGEQVGLHAGGHHYQASVGIIRCAFSM